MKPSIEECITAFQVTLEGVSTVDVDVIEETLRILRAVKEARSEASRLADHRESRMCDGCEGV